MLEDAYVPRHRLAVESELSAKLRVMAHLPGCLRQRTQKTRELTELVDTRDIPNVAGKDGIEILPEPDRTTPRCRSRQGFGISTAQHAARQIVRAYRSPCPGALAREHAIEPVADPARDFTLGEG